ncbi:hypothetical protein RND71_008412 [Anisodus tanguticus]|uniref:Uncharacterized protein n=1 Tax=Anisodus tanguticus TaxID=243964 RepID=A0AAE1VJY5_9SOLA|nr:hypothetical protein RND71_008412 [Anisodus tanguticus]
MDTSVVCLPIREEEWPLRVHDPDVVLTRYLGVRIAIEGDNPDLVLLCSFREP